MSIGPSGRIVVEVEPELKRELHSALLKDGTTLKDWFIGMATQCIADRKIQSSRALGVQSSDSPRQQNDQKA